MEVRRVSVNQSTGAPSGAASVASAMFAAGVASLVGVAAYAYSYNLGRFRFNALQRQECLHHYQESKLASYYQLLPGNENPYFVLI